jgi:hypothetical protein
VGLRHCDNRERRFRRASGKSQTPSVTNAHGLGERTLGSPAADVSWGRMVVVEENTILLVTWLRGICPR